MVFMIVTLIDCDCNYSSYRWKSLSISPFSPRAEEGEGESSRCVEGRVRCPFGPDTTLTHRSRKRQWVSEMLWLTLPPPPPLPRINQPGSACFPADGFHFLFHLI